MNWGRWLGFSPYKKLWFWAGRPFEAEWLVSTLWFWMGVLTACAILRLLVRIFPGALSVNFIIFWIVAICLVGWAIYTFGYIRGHVHWGKDWIKGQQGK